MRLTSSTAARLEDLPIPPGPLAGLLQAARHQLAAAARERGIAIAISSDFAELLELNERETRTGTWYPMLPATNPHHRALSAANGFWLRGTDASGAVFTVQAALLYEVGAVGVGPRLADLSLFYDDPAAVAAGERCDCRSPAAAATTGRTVFTCTGWTRPDWRGRRLFPLFHRVSRLVSWLRWQPDALWGVVQTDAVRAWSEGIMGPRHLDDEPAIVYHRGSGERHDLRFLLFTRAQALGDLAALAAATAVDAA